MLSRFLRSLLGPRREERPPGAALSVGMAAHGNAEVTRQALEARRLHPNTRVFSFTRNLEYCESVNAFLSHARGEQMLFLSNDIFASPAYLGRILATASANPDCGIIRGCSNFVDNNSTEHNLPISDCATREVYFAFAEEVADNNRDSHLLDERFLVGDAFLATRRLIERIGTFDTRFRGYYGDSDFGLRAQIAGLRVVLECGAFKYGIAPGRASVHGLPWEDLARRKFDPALHYVAPKDYSEHLLR